jgi:hypothetical protein
MIRLMLPLALLALAACAERTGTDGSEDDFAARVGAGQGAAAPVATTAVAGPPPAGASVFALEKLDDISGVDLGPRAGGCTFSANGAELLVAAAPADRALPGKAAVRIGGRLVQLDTAPGGIAALEAGTVFTGEGFSVRVKPIGERQGQLLVTDGANETKVIAGNWVCA